MDVDNAGVSTLDRSEMFGSGGIKSLSTLNPAIVTYLTRRKGQLSTAVWWPHKAHVGTFKCFTVFTTTTMFSKSVLAAFTTLVLTAAVSADGLYSKGSAVLQVDGKSYNKLVAKSNQVSVSLGPRIMTNVK